MLAEKDGLGGRAGAAAGEAASAAEEDAANGLAGRRDGAIDEEAAAPSRNWPRTLQRELTASKQGWQTRT